METDMAHVTVLGLGIIGSGIAHNILKAVIRSPSTIAPKRKPRH
jgi:3-hydroxyacyl-CoA dehydrogenase